MNLSDLFNSSVEEFELAGSVVTVSSDITLPASALNGIIGLTVNTAGKKVTLPASPSAGDFITIGYIDSYQTCDILFGLDYIHLDGVMTFFYSGTSWYIVKDDSTNPCMSTIPGTLKFKKYSIPTAGNYPYYPGNAKICTLDANTILFVYANVHDGVSAKASAMIGKIDGITITFGSEYTFVSVNPDYRIQPCTCALTESKALIYLFITDINGNYISGGCLVASITSTDIIFGPNYAFPKQPSGAVSLVKLSDTRGFMSFKDNADGYGKSVIVNISGTNITYGTVYTFYATSVYYISIAFLSEDKVLIVFNDGGDLTVKGIIATISGSTITHSSQYLVSNNNFYLSVAALTETKAVAVFSYNYSVYGVVLNITGTSITVGSTTDLTGAVGSGLRQPSVIKLDSDHCLFTYTNVDTYATYLYLYVCTVSGGTITRNNGAYIYNDIGGGSGEVTNLDSCRAVIASSYQGSHLSVIY